MSIAVLKVPPQFPVGTSVSAYPDTGQQPSGPPAVTALETHPVDANSLLTFTSLASSTRYWAGAPISGVWLYFEFTTPAAAPGGIGVADLGFDVATQAELDVTDAELEVADTGSINPTAPPYNALPGLPGAQTGIQDAVDDVSAAGGGIVQLPPGEFITDYTENPLYAGYFACLHVPGNVWLKGSGEGATKISLVAGAASHSSATIIGNLHIDNAHGANDENIRVSDLTVDGNGASQTTLYQGISWSQVRGARHHRVRVHNVRGTASFPPGETFFFSSLGSADLSYVDCEAIGDAGTHGSGFGDNYATNVAYVACRARGMSAGMGFASYHGRNVTRTACHAQKCGGNGFNDEYGTRVINNACHAGGHASDGVSMFPFTTDQNLGNTGTGFVVNACTRSELNACFSSYNGDNGLNVVSTGSDHSDVRVNGGGYENNTNAGLRFGDAFCAQASWVSPGTRTAGNGSQWNLQPTIGLYGGATEGFALPAPAYPGSGVPLTNPFPHDATVYLVGGTVTFALVDGANVGPRTTLMVPAGKAIQVNDTGAPTWVWVRC